MKRYYLVALALLMLLGSCKKDNNGGNTQKPPNTKKWLVKSIIGKYDAKTFSHLIVQYNDTGRIIKLGWGLSGIRDTFGTGIQKFVDYTYDSTTGRLIFMKPNDAPGYNFVYISPYEIQMIPKPYDASRDGIGTFSFNAHGRNELDSKISFIPPGVLGAGKTYHNYIYNNIGGLQAENIIDDKGVEQDFWAYRSTSLTKAIPNPLVGTSIEQRLVYFTSPFGFLQSYDMMGETWSNGIIEYYSYGSGTKKVTGVSGSNYKVNSDGLVIQVNTQEKTDAPTFSGNWIYLEPYYITYEQH